MKKRSIALVLCLSLIFSIFTYISPHTLATEKSVSVLYDGKEISELTIRQSEKSVLKCLARGFKEADYQWQLLLDCKNLLWVDIYDKTEQKCEISYAVLKSILDEANSAYIRCAVTDGDEVFYSEPVCLTVTVVYGENGQETSLAQSEQAAKSAPLRSSALRGTASQYVTITVKYLDQSSLTGEESAIYSPYTARIERGSSFNQSIVSPAFLGFAPYYDGDGDGEPDEDATTVTLSYASVTENAEIKVYYKPVQVNFAVRYFFQNVSDDLYTEDISRYHTDRAETGTIIEDGDLRAWAGNTEGFEKMYHIPESVAADGSTVFECYYDRNYYLIQFDTDGGFGVEPVYARYGSPFLTGTPTKPGYTFLGWERLTADTDGDGVPDAGSGNAEDVASEVPAYTLYYRALWETDRTSYSVAYWSLAGGDRQYLGARKETNVEPGAIVSGADDLNTEYSNIFRYEEHTHSVETGCYGSCPFNGHTHTLSCYTQSSLPLAQEQTGTALSAFNSMLGLVTDAVEGAVYKYAYRNFVSTTYYNFFYLDGIWYYLGTGTSYSGISLSGALSNPSRNNFSYVAASANMCEADSHTHTEGCLSCHKLEHTHTQECNPDPRYYVFDSADQNVTVNGDGSTIVNIYYHPQEYYLRFIYARSKENSQGNTQYYVVGGSTYGFGGYYNQSEAAGYSTTELLRQVPEGQWGEVEALPQFYPNEYDTNTDISQYNHGTYLDEQTGYTYYYFYFTAYYGENISLKWPIGVLKPVKIVGTHSQTDLQYAYFSAWNGEFKVKYTQDNLNGNQTVTGRQMLLDERLLYDEKFEDSPVVNYLGFWDNGADISWSVPKMYRYRLMLETPNGSVEHDGKYYEQFQAFRTFDNASIAEQEPGMIPGFTFSERTAASVSFTSPVTGETIPDSYDLYFWYTRNTYALKYFNYDNVLNTIEVPYDTLLTRDGYYKEPDYYPSALEPNAYEFVGWYTSPECENGSEVEFDKDRMPAEDIVWYAKWVPKRHTVNFFTSYDEMISYENGDTSVSPYKSYTKNHGSVIGRVENPEQTGDTDLIFKGWFYMDNGVRKAFSPLSMAISGDMNIFADWSNSSLQPYLITYLLQSDPTTEVAKNSSGFAYEGSTRTFTAKAGSPYNQLFDEYNSGYFPTVASHSITMQQESDRDNPERNVFSFYYVKAQNIEYTVRYVNKETGAVMDALTKVTSDSVVTERFKAYENMVPDAFYKRLELSVEQYEETGKYVGTKDNVITFYYSPNTDSTYYAVHFMQEKSGATDAQRQDFAIDGSGGYEENGIIEGVGNIGAAVSVAPREIAGFELIQGQTVSVIDGVQKNVPYADGHYEITVTQSGTELYIFYERLKYNYTVRYYLYNTTQQLLEDKIGVGSYGDSVAESAPDISDYTCVSKSTQTISIREDSTQNVIVFYYAPVQYVAEYAAVPSDGGVLSNTIEVLAGTQELTGSVPTANMYYGFEGWYLDEACTQSADGYGVTEAETNRFIPDKSKLSATERNIFYAKFVRNAGDLTVVRNGTEDSSQVFVYEVKNNATGEAVYVTVVGNGSVTINDLPFGEYTVTQQNGWSWRYGDSAQTAPHQYGNTTVRFSAEANTDKWLSGNSPLLQNQRGSTE